MQENNENDYPESVDSAKPKPKTFKSCDKKTLDKGKLLIGVVIAIVCSGLAYVFPKTFSIWGLAIPAIIVFLLLNKQYRKTGIVIIEACLIPILLLILLVALLYGACMLGTGELSHFK